MPLKKTEQLCETGRDQPIAFPERSSQIKPKRPVINNIDSDPATIAGLPQSWQAFDLKIGQTIESEIPMYLTRRAKARMDQLYLQFGLCLRQPPAVPKTIECVGGTLEQMLIDDKKNGHSVVNHLTIERSSDSTI